jgi:hypothetical protein
LTVKTQSQIYSQRQLSIMGRVTVMNILILSKIWYTLRLLKPTQRFFQRLRSIIYQFVWQKKHPSLRKDKIFLPWNAGGQKVLDPAIQHVVLQKRWLKYIFNPTEHPSFTYPLILAHLSMFPKSTHCPLLPFYDTEYRKGAVCDSVLSIWSVIFNAFDAISKGFPLQLSSIPLQTIMELPLHKLLVLNDDSHWTVKHKTFLGQQFFIFDESQDRLRLRVQGEYNRYPRLCAKLFHDILQTRIVELHSCVWPHILEAPPNEMTNWSTHSLVTTVASSTQWKLCSPLVIRQTIQATISTGTQYIPSIIKIFWTCPMYPNARTVYFRCLSKCIPTKKVLVKYGIAPSTICSLYHLQEDSRRHFLVDCP